MLAEDLTLAALFGSANGVHRFAGNRAIIIDAAVVGLSRKGLIDALGLSATTRLLLRLGYAQGWRAAPSTDDASRSPGLPAMCAAVERLLSLQGLSRLGPLETHAGDCIVTLHESCEAIEYRQHCGPTDYPVCWFACGFTSGYLSHWLRRCCVSREEHCATRGDPLCRIHVVRVSDVPLDPADDPYGADGCDELLREFGLEDVAIEPTQDLAGAREGRAFISDSPRMRALAAAAERAAELDSTVLITGESGVGKSRLARYIHDRSPRRRSPFISVNCGALPDTLLENELFGHRRGAFTGAVDDRQGLFEAAQGGTIFLDEIGEIAPEMQVKLLQVVQERHVRRLGETKSRPIDVRIVAATNRNLESAVADGRFREDLYYRLDVLAFRVPALRERDDELRALLDSLLRDTARRLKRPIRGYTRAALARLLSYHWPGNIRELENVIERVCAFADRAFIDVLDLPDRIREPSPRARPVFEGPTLWEAERDFVLAALRRHDGNKVHAARELGISNSTLHRKLKSYEDANG